MLGVSEERIRCDTVTKEQRRSRTLFKPTRRADGALADFLRCLLLTYGSQYARRSAP